MQETVAEKKAVDVIAELDNLQGLLTAVMNSSRTNVTGGQVLLDNVRLDDMMEALRRTNTIRQNINFSLPISPSHGVSLFPCR